MSKTIHFNDKTNEITIGSSVGRDGEEISLHVGEYNVYIITSESNNSIEVMIEKPETTEETQDD